MGWDCFIWDEDKNPLLLSRKSLLFCFSCEVMIRKIRVWSSSNESREVKDSDLFEWGRKTWYPLHSSQETVSWDLQQLKILQFIPEGDYFQSALWGNWHRRRRVAGRERRAQQGEWGRDREWAWRQKWWGWHEMTFALHSTTYLMIVLFKHEVELQAMRRWKRTSPKRQSSQSTHVPGLRRSTTIRYSYWLRLEEYLCIWTAFFHSDNPFLLQIVLSPLFQTVSTLYLCFLRFAFYRWRSFFSVFWILYILFSSS